VLILDEPTGVPTPQEADHLFRILAQLKAQGKTVIFITHKLREIMAITDTVSVMRRGEMVATKATVETNPAELAELMVGRRVLLRVQKKKATPGETILEVRNLTVRDEKGVARVDDVSFVVRSGEIVGIAGVSGNGQSELLEAIACIRKPTEGRILIEGQELLDQCDPRHSRLIGLAHVPEDRQRLGLVTSFEAAESAILGWHFEKSLGKGWLLDRGAVVDRCRSEMAAFDVRPQDPHLKTAKFSGGNQQKIVLAREIERDPKLLIVGQPTRGVDIGAIEFIHRRLIELRDMGKAILLISVELDEIRSLSDRILVMCQGRIVGEGSDDTDENELGLMMSGIGREAA
jgi:simple sugar transport system ATP-binding protein